MQKDDIINKYNDEEDKLLAARILDKIKLAKTRNQIEYTDFLSWETCACGISGQICRTVWTKQV